MSGACSSCSYDRPQGFSSGTGGRRAGVDHHGTLGRHGDRGVAPRGQGIDLTIWRLLLIFDAEHKLDIAHTMISLWKGLEALSPASRPSSSTTAMWRR